MPKKTCKTCIHARPICAGSNTMYCGHPSLSMLQFSLYSDDKAACEFYESKECECIQERSCKDCENFRSYDTKPGFGTCYHISVANTVSDKTATICQWFSNGNDKTKSREEIEDRLKNEKEDASDERFYIVEITSDGFVAGPGKSKSHYEAEKSYEKENDAIAAMVKRANELIDASWHVNYTKVGFFASLYSAATLYSADGSYMTTKSIMVGKGGLLKLLGINIKEGHGEMTSPNLTSILDTLREVNRNGGENQD